MFSIDTPGTRYAKKEILFKFDLTTFNITEVLFSIDTADTRYTKINLYFKLIGGLKEWRNYI